MFFKLNYSFFKIYIKIEKMAMRSDSPTNYE